MSDPLAQYRRPGATPRPAPASPQRRAPGERVAYTEETAFATAVNPRDIQVIPRRGVSGQNPFYTYLVNITFDTHPDDDLNFTALLLTISGMVILIEGRNLKPIYDALRLGVCSVVREYDPARHLPLPGVDIRPDGTVHLERNPPSPGDYTGPVVSRIEVEIIRPGAPAREEQTEDA